MLLSKKDIKIEYFKSSGPGGQHKNKRFTAVKAIHIPSGISCLATEQRSQAQNKNVAIQRLAEKVARLTKKKKVRLPTALPQRVKNLILEKKKRRSQIKLTRKKVRHDEE